MMGFLVIIGSMIALDLVLWRWADQRLRPLRHAAIWRGAFAAFMAFQFLSVAFVLGSRFSGRMVPMPLPLLMAVYVWHLFVLPVSALVLAAASLVAMLSAAGAKALRPRSIDLIEPPDNLQESALVLPTRRQVLLGAAVALPPLLTSGSVGAGMAQMDRLRVRRLMVSIPDLPPALNGLTIAHVTDVHTGRFTDGPRLRQIAEQVNALRSDLVVLTGDLIDFRLADLPAALDMVRRLDPRHGLFMCEGNHDLFESRTLFAQKVKQAGIELLQNESRLLTIRNQPVQMLGLRWGRPGRRHSGPSIQAHMHDVAKLRHAEAFPILLAHHPHAFDEAVEVGIPLTLAGHTHGGQLMLTEKIGPGSLLFKYWSGLYRQGQSSLVVSNGVGNWFPLRINAPAEIIHVTLHHAEKS